MSGESENNEIGENARAEHYVALLIQHEPKVRAFLRGLLPGWSDVDEVVQEASLVAWRKFDQFESGTAFGGWFFTIARFEALKYRRKLARSPLVFSEELLSVLADEESDQGANTIVLSRLEVCLNQLEAEKREIILRAHQPGVFIRNLAQQLGRSEAALYKLVQRLRIALLDCVSRPAVEGSDQ